ncbi:arylsulfatase [Denitratisoma sp. DHT3]|uniref:arylsulfatase n=1 Tax=Denitratisoma sp. DHT3 TaxID=1981880 RepID=UPI001C951F06|nr:arylsulfatase [Denitratisoma sp. DHT3]
MNSIKRIALTTLALCNGAAGLATAGESLPRPDPAFQGVIAPTRAASKPDWPQMPHAPKGAPNVVVVLLDDVGFAAPGTFGGAIPTPSLDKLAKQGLTYNQFHVVGICSPTRAALLSGRNHHQVGFGTVTDNPAGFPGYNMSWPKSAASVAEVLRQNGYSTAAFGKWHNTPAWEVSTAGPFDRWPTGLGFDYFYGFMAAQSSQWTPQLYRNTTPVEPAQRPPAYHFTTDMVDDAIHWLRQQRAEMPDRPYFAYLATGATHAPHHAPKEWIEKFRGKFDQGWDKYREETFARQKKLGIIPANARLAPRPASVQAWESIPPAQRRLLARQMEVFAGYLAHTDHEIGRFLAEARRQPGGDNTLVLYVAGDNGPSPEGGPEGSRHHTSRVYGLSDTPEAFAAAIDELGGEHSDLNYPTGWALATATPFPGAKQMASTLGGIRNALVVSWPSRIKEGFGIRSQFHHVVDIVPTIYEAAGIAAPDRVNGIPQIPIDGHSMVYSFAAPKAPSNHTLQYFEVMGNRGIYQDGWFAGATHYETWNILETLRQRKSLADDKWTLHNLNEDFSGVVDLAAKYPEKLAQLKAAFDAEAKRNQVLPLSDSPLDNFFSGGVPDPTAGRKNFVYGGDTVRVTPALAPPVLGRQHRIEARIERPAANSEGVIAAFGGGDGGYALYVKDGHLVYELNLNGLAHERIVSRESLPTGASTVAFEFQPDGNVPANPMMKYFVRPGTGRLFVNGQPAGEHHFARFGGFGHPTIYSETLDIGRDLGSAVGEGYAAPFPFSGKVEEVRFMLQ